MKPLIAAMRDCTLYRCPSGFGLNPRPPKWHVITDRPGNGYGPGPACGIPWHTEDSEMLAKDVHPDDRCQRPGCRSRWPSVDTQH